MIKYQRTSSVQSAWAVVENCQVLTLSIPRKELNKMSREEKDLPTISVDEFIDWLKMFEGQDFRLSFGGLDFYRLKQRGPKLVQIEFNESVYLDDLGDVVVENH